MGTVTVQGRDELGRLIDVVLTTAADVAPPGPEVVTAGGGGGGVTVDNTVDPPAEITTLVAVGADVSTPGEATLAEGSGAVTHRLLEAEIEFADVVFADGYWMSPLEFAVSAGTWVLDVWARIILDPSGVGATYCALWWTTSLAEVGVDDALPNAGFEMLNRAAEPAASGGIQVVNTRVTADQSYESTVGTRQDLQDGAALRIRPFPALVPAACDLIPLLMSDHAGGASGWLGSVRLYALVAEPA